MAALTHAEFTEELQVRWDALMDKALVLLELEKMALWEMTAEVPVFGAAFHISEHDVYGNTDAIRSSETLIELEEFAERCFDYTELETIIDRIESARVSLNGEDGVDVDIRAITEHLIDWQSDGPEESRPSEIFKNEYVVSIGQRKANQHEALGNAKASLEYVVQFIDEYRLALLDLPNQAMEALGKYSPYTYAALGTAAITLKVIGMVVNPVAGLAAAEVEKKVIELQAREGSGVAGIFEELRKGAKELHVSFDESMEDLAAKIAAVRQGEYWPDFVCSQPYPQDMAEQSSTSSGSGHTGGGI